MNITIYHLLIKFYHSTARLFTVWRQPAGDSRLLPGYFYMVVLGVVASSPLRGQPNDFCTNAIALVSGVPATMNTLTATSTNDPLPDCQHSFGHGVWYTVTTPNNNVRVDISTCDSDFGTVMEVYTGTCGALARFACVDREGPFCGGRAGMSFSAPSNTTYYILVGGINGSGGNLQIVASIVTPPANDTCEGAVELVSGVARMVNTFDASEFGDGAPLCQTQFGRGVWYKVSTPNHNVRVNIDTCGSDFGTVMEVYKGTCGALAHFTCVDREGPVCGGRAGVSFGAPSNTTYYILVGGINGSGGNLQIVANIVDPPGNDTCEGAIELASGVGRMVNTFDATEFGDGAPLCQSQFGRGVWYKVTTPDHNVRVNIDTCGTDFGTVMEVYSGTCDALAHFTCVDREGPVCGGRAGVSFSAPSNTTYYILVGGINGSGGNLQIVANVVDPPNNDTCEGAIDLVSGVGRMVNTFDATEFGDGAPLCQSQFGRGVWYKVTTPNHDVRVNIDTCGSDFGTVMEVYSGVCGALAHFTCVDREGPFCGGRAGVSFSAPSNTTYYILVGGINGTGGTLQIMANVVDPPGNDTCEGAIELASGVGRMVNTFDATEFGDGAPLCQSQFGRGVWYKMTTPGYNVRLDIDTCSSDFGTVMEVYTGTCGALAHFTCVDREGPFCGGRAGVSFSAPSNTTYYILVGGINGSGGNLQIVATAVTPPTNDTCEGAIELVSGVGRMVNTFHATEFGDGTPVCQSQFGRGVWYKLTVTSPGQVTVDTCNSDFGTIMEVYTGTCDALAHFTCTDRSGPFCGGRAGVRFSTTTNATFYILVGGINGSGGNLQIVANLPASSPPGVSVSSPADGITNQICTAAPFFLSAQAHAGSYPLDHVDYFDGPLLLARVTDPKNGFGNISWLAQGVHDLSAQVVDNSGARATSQVHTVTLTWPTQYDVLFGGIASNLDCVFCMSALTGRTYVVETITNVQPPVDWRPYFTNQLTDSILVFTNHPSDPKRFFRVNLVP